MTTQLFPDVDQIIEGILAANTITREQKAAFLQELKEQGLTDVMLGKVDALFAAEIDDVQNELGLIDMMLPRLQEEVARAEADALPALQMEAMEFGRECDEILEEDKREATAMERAVDEILRASKDSADTNEADAIRKSLGLN